MAASSCCYAVDVQDPGLIRVFEAWRDQAAMHAPVKAGHLTTWRAACVEAGAFDRKLSLYPVAADRPL